LGSGHQFCRSMVGCPPVEVCMYEVGAPCICQGTEQSYPWSPLVSLLLVPHHILLEKFLFCLG
jgi:hypothetical protein